MPQPPARAFSQKDLPPSVETAYYRKCIDLRRRITDIEDSNDGTRLRITRLNRGIQKMRLERAFLLEQINKHMEYNADDSDRSSSPPPTPTDKPLRSKRSGGGGGGSTTGARKATPPSQTNQIATLGSVTQAQTQSPASTGTQQAGQQTQPQQQSSTSTTLPQSSLAALSSPHSTPAPSTSTPYPNPPTTSATSPHPTLNGTATATTTTPTPANPTVLPPLHSLPALQTPAPRAYFDPAYDDQRASAVPSAAGDSASAAAAAATAQNGDTEMVDVDGGVGSGR
ncbi:hypothetical protein IAQ61_007301 [Plenodomus lingam]|uniref:uncharacterized protein n=1 Tax=Leptosphaeria maculans TaxID=5022 RepID=UPI00332B8B36|nr:hypothetical protein IAQ61_007301 [Plenodomus lingam]